MEAEIRAPIFVIGCPRSGTGAFAWRLTEHPDVATMTNNTAKRPTWLLVSLLTEALRSKHRPSEGHRLWEKLLCHDDDSLTREDVTPRNRRLVRKAISNTLKIFKKPRFLNKCPANSVRMGFLDEVFPDAIFIHIIRDGRAVAHSIMCKRERHEGGYWACKPPGWRAVLDRPLVEGCGLQWKMTVDYVRKSAASLPEERYIEVRYEDYVERPREILNAVAQKCGLTWDEDLLSEVVHGVENMNFKWRENFSPSDIETLNSLLGDLLVELGYEV